MVSRLLLFVAHERVAGVRLLAVKIRVDLPTLGLPRRRLTLLLGVLADIHANAYVVDAIIRLSAVYKALENIGAFRRMGLMIDPRAAVFLHGA